MLATINGTGQEAEIYTDLTDHLSGANVVLNSNSEVVETTDYYPFGKIRLDNKTTDFAEQRKYIGQEYDEDTGLNYLNARYYNSAIARFVSQDPVALATPEKFLQDPQQLNYYSYARNNPIVGSDPSGEITYGVSHAISTPIFSLVGAHVSAYVVPEPGENLYMDYNGKCTSITEPITFGAYPVGIPLWNWHLTFMANESGDSTINKKAISGEHQENTASVKIDAAREGMTNQRLDQNVINSFTSANPDQGYYNPVGSRILTPYSNSNNAFTYLMMNSGVSREQMNDISHTLASNNRWSAGLGMSLLSPTVIQNKAQNVFNSFSFSIQTLTKVLESYNSGLKNK